MNRTSRLAITLILAAMIGFPTVPVSAASNPTFDITGVWRNSIGETLQFFQEKDELNGIFVNATWAHRIEGRYVSLTKAKLVLIRRTRPNTCEMTMTVDISVNSANSLLITSVAAETACGLTLGQNSPQTFTRVL